MPEPDTYGLILKLEGLVERQYELRARNTQMQIEMELRRREYDCEADAIQKESQSVKTEIRRRLGVLDPVPSPQASGTPANSAPDLEDIFRRFGELFGDLFPKR
jgi:hypothetical protein